MGSFPVIGISLDCEPAGGWAASPWYALRQNYAARIAERGGLPVLLPHHPDLAAHYADQVDGLMVTGGAFDIDPGLYGERDRHASVTLKDGRTGFELAVLRAALERGKPVLGICGGQQLLNVALGGTLYQHIPDAIPGALDHEQAGPKDQPSHAVEIIAGTRLAAITGQARILVNSTHHQAVKDVAPGLVVNALAPDGVIEGIEDPARPFCLGVQWHPEYCISDADGKLLGAFVECCR
jgi:putative glutamine amidotransferase